MIFGDLDVSHIELSRGIILLLRIQLCYFIFQSNGDGTNVLNGLSDDWEFEETKVMHAQEELRSIRAKIAVLEGKMALEIMYAHLMIEY
jgi:hypothetical protein